MNNEPLTLDKLEEVVERLKSQKLIHMNSKTFELVKQQLDFDPINIAINNYIPDNQAIVFSEKQMEAMKRKIYYIK